MYRRLCGKREGAGMPAATPITHTQGLASVVHSQCPYRRSKQFIRGPYLHKTIPIASLSFLDWRLALKANLRDCRMQMQAASLACFRMNNLSQTPEQEGPLASREVS